MLEATVDRMRRFLPISTTGPRAPVRIMFGSMVIGRTIAGVISGSLGFGKVRSIIITRVDAIGIVAAKWIMAAIGTVAAIGAMAAIGIVTAIVDMASDDGSLVDQTLAKADRSGDRLFADW
jgi:hypothetical protein